MLSLPWQHHCAGSRCNWDVGPVESSRYFWADCAGLTSNWTHLSVAFSGSKRHVRGTLSQKKVWSLIPRRCQRLWNSQHPKASPRYVRPGPGPNHGGKPPSSPRLLLPLLGRERGEDGRLLCCIDMKGEGGWGERGKGRCCFVAAVEGEGRPKSLSLPALPLYPFHDPLSQGPV